MEQESDNRLIELASVYGNQKAFEVLYKRYVARIFNFTYRLLGNAAMAEDVTQNTFMSVYQNLHLYKPGKSAGPWIYRIGLNSARKYLRTEFFRRRTVSLDEPSLEPDKTLIDSIASKEMDPKRALTNKQLHEELQKAIGALPDKYRSIFILHDLECMPYEDIQDILKIPYNTALTHLARARLLLRKRIDPSKFGIYLFLFLVIASSVNPIYSYETDGEIHV